MEETLNTTEKVVELYADLIAEGEEIKKTCKRLYFSGNKKTIDGEVFQAWKMNCLSLLKSTFGSSSPYYDSFANYKFFDYFNSTQIFLGILKGAKKDVEKGYFFHKDLMLSVNIYASLIKRAQVLIEDGDQQKAGGILETTLLEILAKICENKHVGYTPQDSIGSFAQLLFSRKLLSEDAKKRLEELAGESFRQTPAEVGQKDLLAVSNWMLNFLNDYLGSQILILN